MSSLSSHIGAMAPKRRLRENYEGLQLCLKSIEPDHSGQEEAAPVQLALAAEDKVEVGASASSVKL
jgi:hypothetical protein